MKLHQKIFVALCVAAFIGGSLGFVFSPRGQSLIARVEAPAAATPTPRPVATVSPTPSDARTVHVVNGVATVSYTFDANNGLATTLHIDVSDASTGTRLAWAWKNATLDSAQTVSVDVPARYLTPGKKLLVTAYADGGNGVTPYGKTFFVTVA